MATNPAIDKPAAASNPGTAAHTSSPSTPAFPVAAATATPAAAALAAGGRPPTFADVLKNFVGRTLSYKQNGDAIELNFTREQAHTYKVDRVEPEFLLLKRTDSGPGALVIIPVARILWVRA